MIRKLTIKQAKPFFWHPLHGDMTAKWMEYRACDGVCGAFHLHLWPGVWMGHLGVKRDAFGKSDDAARAILQAFAMEKNASRIIGWVSESNRPTLAFCKRIGFETDGRLLLSEPVTMLGWSA